MSPFLKTQIHVAARTIVLRGAVPPLGAGVAPLRRDGDAVAAPEGRACCAPVSPARALFFGGIVLKARSRTSNSCVYGSALRDRGHK